MPLLTLKRVPAAVATVGIGYGIAKYKQSQKVQQQQYSQYSRPTQASATQERQNDVLMNAYGDRSSLSELEEAYKAYEAQRGSR